MNEMTINKNDLLRKIQELCFYAVDLNLFLDTHPDDAKAIQDYNYISKMLKQFEDMYVQNFGPLKNFGNSLIYSSTWTWVSENEKWPWEGSIEI